MNEGDIRMQMWWRLLILLIVLGFLPACAPTVAGPAAVRDMGRYLSLVLGQSTKADVSRAFGQPYDVQPTDEGSRWIYYYFVERTNGWTYVPFAGLLAGGSNLDTTITTVTFDETDRLLRFEVQERHTYKNMWVAVAELAAGTDRPEVRVEREMARLQLPYDAKAARWMRGTAAFTQ